MIRLTSSESNVVDAMISLVTVLWSDGDKGVVIHSPMDFHSPSGVWHLMFRRQFLELHCAKRSKWAGGRRAGQLGNSTNMRVNPSAISLVTCPSMTFSICHVFVTLILQGSLKSDI